MQICLWPRANYYYCVPTANTYLTAGQTARG